MTIKADKNPIQPTTESLDAGGIFADVLSGTDAPEEEWESDVVDSADSSDEWGDPTADDADADAEPGDEPADDEPAAEDDAEPAEDDAEPAADEKKADDGKAKDREEIEVTDETGRRKIEIDYSDRKSIRRAHEQAAGARKLYARNRELRDQLAAIQPKVDEGTKATERWSKLEGKYAEAGMDGVIEMLTGRPADEYISAREAEKKRLAAMSPEERALLDRTKSTDKQVAEAQRIREEAERLRAEALAERESADLERLESVVHPEFEKVRMAGKLGDKAREHRIDTMIWDYVQSEMVRLAEKGTQPNRDVVRQLFSDASSLFSSAVETRASKQTAATIDKKKKEATREAQSAVVRSERQLRRGVTNDADLSNTAGATNFLLAAMGAGKRRSK